VLLLAAIKIMNKAWVSPRTPTAIQYLSSCVTCYYHDEVCNVKCTSALLIWWRTKTATEVEKCVAAPKIMNRAGVYHFVLALVLGYITWVNILYVLTSTLSGPNRSGVGADRRKKPVRTDPVRFGSVRSGPQPSRLETVKSSSTSTSTSQ
jgi:hypothetical protein